MAVFEGRTSKKQKDRLGSRCVPARLPRPSGENDCDIRDDYARNPRLNLGPVASKLPTGFCAPSRGRHEAGKGDGNFTSKLENRLMIAMDDVGPLPAHPRGRGRGLAIRRDVEASRFNEESAKRSRLEAENRSRQYDRTHDPSFDAGRPSYGGVEHRMSDHYEEMASMSDPSPALLQRMNKSMFSPLSTVVQNGIVPVAKHVPPPQMLSQVLSVKASFKLATQRGTKFRSEVLATPAPAANSMKRLCQRFFRPGDFREHLRNKFNGFVEEIRLEQMPMFPPSTQHPEPGRDYHGHSRYDENRNDTSQSRGVAPGDPPFPTVVVRKPAPNPVDSRQVAAGTARRDSAPRHSSEMVGVAGHPRRNDHGVGYHDGNRGIGLGLGRGYAPVYMPSHTLGHGHAAMGTPGDNRAATRVGGGHLHRDVVNLRGYELLTQLTPPPSQDSSVFLVPNAPCRRDSGYSALSGGSGPGLPMYGNFYDPNYPTTSYGPGPMALTPVVFLDTPRDPPNYHQTFQNRNDRVQPAVTSNANHGAFPDLNLPQFPNFPPSVDLNFCPQQSSKAYHRERTPRGGGGRPVQRHRGQGHSSGYHRQAHVQAPIFAHDANLDPLSALEKTKSHVFHPPR